MTDTTTFPTANPLLDATDLPDFTAVQPVHVVPAIEQAIASHRAIIAEVSEGARDDFASVVLASERADFDLSRTWSPVGHLSSVADTPELREAHAAGQSLMTAYLMEAGQNSAHYAALGRVAARPDFRTLPVAQQRAVDLALRGFRLAGVALEGEARQRFLEIGMELSELSTSFANAVMDATEAWTEHVTDERALAGVPDSDRAILASYAKEKGLDGWLITLRQPSVQAILLHASDRALRERVYRANATRASEQAEDKNFDNSARIEKIMALRHEAAQILGFADAAAHSLETKMATDAQEALSFLADLASRARPMAETELAEARAFATAHLGLEELASWDLSYVAEAMRRTLHGVDQEALKAYFPLPRVLAGTEALFERLFGVRLVPRPGVAVWHDDVIFYDLLDANGQVIAGVYLDLFARAGKRGGAWMDVCQSRFRDADRFHLPIAYLTTNFAPAAWDRPSLLTHNDVVTLFHEFGHVLHHLLSEVDIPSVGGISGVEWDAVELPSQFMENFAWDRATLIGLSGHVETGEPLPEAMFDRLLAARQFQAGLALLRQVEFATFDLQLHRDYDPVVGARVDATLERVRKEVAAIQPPSWNRFAHGFTHIFAGGYAAGYYSYLWAELLSADAFELFAHSDVSGGGGTAFRREILAVGASRTAADSFRAFAGRAPEIDALLKIRGLVAG
ncbi:M3 family metallopeptidase [Sphingobium sufflavum]|uniref:M3 family metallopeptidase n=1 Tax=Sphingobium sufflavum TaxID=1129547 RepID=UPI001F2B085B|nr:M3 family metallopeptidase [Sphingobium sufflavum]MCE7797766.1 M3 family metallopeptidase [Sphingobium sufflavum]